MILTGTSNQNRKGDNMTKPNEILEALYYAGYEHMKALIYPNQLSKLPKNILEMFDGIQVDDLAIR